jgi:integrase
MGYHTGMRKGEILSLRWDCVDFVEGRITLRAGTTKNEEARMILLTDELFEVLRKQRLLRDEKCPDCVHVFFRNGEKIKCFKEAWVVATKKAVLEDTIRFWALRLKELGITKYSPREIISRNTDWSHIASLKNEMGMTW